jgi:hypothetical protein
MCASTFVRLRPDALVEKSAVGRSPEAEAHPVRLDRRLLVFLLVPPDFSSQILTFKV